MRIESVPIPFVAKEKKFPRPGGGRGRRALSSTTRPILCAARATQRTARLKRGKRKSEQSPYENERRRREEGRSRWIGEEGRRIVELGRGGRHGGCAVRRVKRGREEGPRACETYRFGACESDTVRGRREREVVKIPKLQLTSQSCVPISSRFDTFLLSGK